MFILTYVPDGFQVQLFKEIRSQWAYLNFTLKTSSSKIRKVPTPGDDGVDLSMA